jgi:kynurenine formamidase
MLSSSNSGARGSASEQAFTSLLITFTLSPIHVTLQITSPDIHYFRFFFKMRLNPNEDVSSFPKRSALPHIAGTPKGNAWFWGGNDELGRLNLLTPERRAKSAQENVKTGETISLDLPLNVPNPPLFGRKTFHHQIKTIGKGGFDDELSFNTQSSSQWDGFRHFANPIYECHYNGVLAEEIMRGLDDDGEDAPEQSRKLGTDAWAKSGIVGRGVLLDIYTWAQQNNKAFDPFTSHPITVDDLLACARAQNTTFQTGDILIIRTGFTQRYTSLTPSERTARSALGMAEHTYAGLEASDAMKDFLYDNYFAAAASDTLGLEVWPPSRIEESLHASMLSMWGMPIGELWDLEGLGEKCKELGRWTFLVVSKPLDVPGGVGSPPNALAIF